MIQLSIEEKAKRYDEILARAKGANIPYYKDDIMSKVKEFVDYLIPELKESGDERIRKALIQNLKERFGTKGSMGEGLDMPDVLVWLEKQGEQKPAWSEEDEYCRHQLIVFCENCMVQDRGAIRCANWLKSLRPQTAWKPSNEQMTALKDALNDAIWQYDHKGSPLKEEVTRKHAETIESLYNDLKKLK